MVQSAVAYSANGKIIVAPVVRTTTGLGLEVEPIVHPPIAADIARGLRDALARSAVVVEHPSQGEWKGSFKPFQDAAGVRSHSAFMKTARRVSIDVVDDHVKITPERNLGPKEGFEPIADAAVLFPVQDEHGAAFALLRFLTE
ncbi:MAG: hypothetical protein B7Z08_09375 [Sphingomonadales bacterium 32-68-7]|nr:MAG: hypothetical protein B7Z33_12010 [Sphingomonadales bacterium 12-68-11]OYX08502.1 MAG: hypothetical protein B7Z08_09375 [Sphingomonadales bacterium 32-68-7]